MRFPLALVAALAAVTLCALDRRARRRPASRRTELRGLLADDVIFNGEQPIWLGIEQVAEKLAETLLRMLPPQQLDLFEEHLTCRKSWILPRWLEDRTPGVVCEIDLARGPVAEAASQDEALMRGAFAQSPPVGETSYLPTLGANS